VHMTRTILILGVYCSLETPARSAAEYPHQLHKKPKILGLNSNPSLIYSPRLLVVTDFFHSFTSRSHLKNRKFTRIPCALCPVPYALCALLHHTIILDGYLSAIPTHFIRIPHPSPTAVSICCMISSSGAAASIWQKISSSVKCFREIAPVGHTELQRPSPLQRTGFTLAFLPCDVS